MITIFTPTYNRKKELERLYESLLNQDYDDFEWLIVDDGSIDDTEKYVNSLIKKNKIKINILRKKKEENHQHIIKVLIWLLVIFF